MSAMSSNYVRTPLHALVEERHFALVGEVQAPVCADSGAINAAAIQTNRAFALILIIFDSSLFVYR
jgi:hypothetical protein